jgi:hypothetical protein
MRFLHQRFPLFVETSDMNLMASLGKGFYFILDTRVGRKHVV